MRVLFAPKFAVAGFALVLFAHMGFAGGPRGGGGGIGFGAPGSAGALGGSFASRGIARPLGGVSLPASRGAGRGYYRSPRYSAPVAPYAYSWYVPNYFDLDTLNPYAGLPSYPAYAPETIAPAPPSQPPVIINQYFSGGQPAPVAAAPGAYPAAPGSGAPLAPVDNYYLIAYKDHRIDPALSWWIEGNLLHYVTLENTHNQASLDLIDLNLTRTLNRSRNIPFSLDQAQ